MVVGTIPVMGNTILLCRRAIDPRRDKYTLPAGWLENGETVTACALRETQEEAWVEVDDLKPYVLANLPFINSSCSNVMCAPPLHGRQKVLFYRESSWFRTKLGIASFPV
jgi:8-oxo-dGTP pyrophosphatase MutT (NUDIX family)